MAALTQHADDAESASAALVQLQLQVDLQESLDHAESAPASAATAAAATGTHKGPPASLLGQTVVLQRSDAPLLLEAMHSTTLRTSPGSSSSSNNITGSDSVTSSTAPAAAVDGDGTGKVVLVTPSMLRALVLGGWTIQGPQTLRRSSVVLQLCTAFGESCAELLEAVRSADKCRRAAGQYNRHGHSSSLQYPGANGWTQEYADERLKAVKVSSGFESHAPLSSGCKSCRSH